MACPLDLASMSKRHISFVSQFHCKTLKVAERFM